jgi:UBX domain-containing protein 1
MDSNQQDMVAQFCGVTGANANAAQTALTAANWNIEQAVALYLAAQDPGSDDDEDVEDEPAVAPTQSAPQPSSSTTSGRRTGPPSAGGVRTLRDLQASADDDDDDDDEDKKKRDLFAGGEKSALAVQDPSKGSGSGRGGRGGDHFQNILSQARNNAPRAPGGEDDEEEATGPPRPSNFSGRAQTLGGDDAPSRVIGDPTAAPAAGRRPGGASLPRISRTMHLWADGVSIDDGPLFRFDDPANQPLMEQINQGHAPLSMLDVQPGQEVDLNLDPHKDENYVKPKPKYKPFGGSGNRLGSPTPGVAAASSSSTTTAPAPSQQSAVPGGAAPPANQVDESTPTVTLQIRLGDGTRLQSRFNTTQNIGHVYDFVNRASPASTERPWALMTTFPSKELEDKSIVLGDMSDFKRGGVVVQKWK